MPFATIASASVSFAQQMPIEPVCELIFRNRRGLVRLGVRAARQAVLLQRRLHLRDVRFHLVEIDEQRRRVELPLGNAGLRAVVHRRRAHLDGVVTVHAAWESRHRRRRPACPDRNLDGSIRSFLSSYDVSDPDWVNASDVTRTTGRVSELSAEIPPEPK